MSETRNSVTERGKEPKKKKKKRYISKQTSKADRQIKQTDRHSIKNKHTDKRIKHRKQ